MSNRRLDALFGPVRCVFFAMLGAVCIGRAEIIPADRLTEWTPGTIVGVPGGIPTDRNTVYENVATSTFAAAFFTGKCTTGDATFICYDAGFNVNDVGRSISGDGIPAGTRITAVLNYFTALLSAAPAVSHDYDARFSINDRHKCWLDGLHDDSPGINQAIADCPEGQVVYLPAGTYRLEAGIYSKYGRNYTLRGAGRDRTILKPSATCGRAFQAGAGDASHEYTPVTDGATKGSTTISVPETSHWDAGMLLDIRAGVNPTYTHMNKGYPQEFGLPGFTMRITAVIDSTHVKFTPPLPFDLSSYSPEAGVFNNPTGGYVNLTAMGVGYEDFTIDMTDAVDLNVPIYWEQMYGCWLKGLELKNAHRRGGLIWLNIIQSEIRQCYFHDQGGVGSGAEGVDLADRCCWNLIEDNIIFRGGGLILADSGYNCAGNVIGYNYLFHNPTPDSTVASSDLDLGHGPHNMFNLVEGNIMSGVESDGYFGSTSHNTIFRNWITATDTVAANNLIAINLKHHSNYYNIVGNVLGTNQFPTWNNGPLNAGAQASQGSGWYEAPIVSGYDSGYSRKADVIYALGFPHIGNTGFASELPANNPPDYTGQTYAVAEGPYDDNVKATLLRHGNYDFFNRAIIWDDSIVDRVIPNSLYLVARPSWWPGTMPWPAVGPELDPMSGTNPALLRFQRGGGAIHAPTGLRITPPAS